MKSNFQLCIKNTNFVTTSETSEHVFVFVLISSFVSFGVCIYLQYFFKAMRNQIEKKLLELIKWRSKVYQNKLSRICALNFDQWKLLSENISQWEFGYGLFTKLLRLIVVHDFSPFIKTQKRYPTSFHKISVLTWRLPVISISHILWTKLLENLLL